MRRRDWLRAALATLLPSEASAHGGAVPDGGRHGPSAVPTRSNALVEVFFSKPTGRTVHPQLFGVATGGMTNDRFAACRSRHWREVVGKLNLPLLRVNGAAFAGESRWHDGLVSSFAETASLFLPPTCTIILGAQLREVPPPRDYERFCYDLASYWRRAGTVPAKYFEPWNEPEGNGLDGDQAKYVALARAMLRGVRRAVPDACLAAPVSAGYDGAMLSAIVTALKPGELGIADWHDYLYCRTQDAVPSDDEVSAGLNAKGIAPITGGIRNAEADLAHTYASQLPLMIGEYNLECTADQAEGRTQTPLGACFMTSVLMSCAEASSHPVWAAVWDLYDDSGAGYNLIASDGTVGSQYFMLKELIASMPGQMMTVRAAPTQLRAWATRSSDGVGFGLAIVNTSLRAVRGPVVMSGWPGALNGAGVLDVWELSPAHPHGRRSSLQVTNGTTRAATIPGHSVVILQPHRSSVPSH